MGAELTSQTKVGVKRRRFETLRRTGRLPSVHQAIHPFPPIYRLSGQPLSSPHPASKAGKTNPEPAALDTLSHQRNPRAGAQRKRGPVPSRQPQEFVNFHCRVAEAGAPPHGPLLAAGGYRLRSDACGGWGGQKRSEG